MRPSPVWLDKKMGVSEGWGFPILFLGFGVLVQIACIVAQLFFRLETLAMLERLNML